MDCEFVEIRPAKFAKLKDGEVVGVVSEAKADALRAAAEFPDVDVGMIELSVAMSALSAVLLGAFKDHSLGTSLAMISFFCGAGATATLAIPFAYKRIPLTMAEGRAKGLEGNRLFAWALLSWPIRAVRFVFSKDYFQRSEQEMCRFYVAIASLLLAWGCYFLIFVAVVFFLLVS